MLPPLIEKALKQAEERHGEVERLLSQPETLAQQSRFKVLSREFGTLGKLVARYNDYLRVQREIEENDALSRQSSEDGELRQLARDEVKRLQPVLTVLAEELTDRILVEGKDADRNVIIEIRAGTGGDEAALFAGDLYRMYVKYSEQKRWKVEVLDASSTNLGGFSRITFSISGDSVYRDLRYEMGGHRVQRVPETESSGRIHTSAATVAVLGEPEEVEVELKDAEIKMDFYRSSGPGGQNVNKTSSAVRLTHLPTGIVVAIQDESSQHKNRAKAERVLRARIYDHYETERREKEQKIRRDQIGSGDRSQRVRTYNFPQNRVTDHRVGKNFNLERIVREGDLNELVSSLRGYEREQKMKTL